MRRQLNTLYLALFSLALATGPMGETAPFDGDARLLLGPGAPPVEPEDLDSNRYTLVPPPTRQPKAVTPAETAASD